MHSPTHSNNRLSGGVGEFQRDEVLPPPGKGDDYHQTILNSAYQVSVRQLTRMIGLLSATIPAVLPAPCTIDIYSKRRII